MQHFFYYGVSQDASGASLISILEVIITVFVAAVIAGVVVVASGFTVFAFIAIFDAFVVDVFF